MSIPERIKTRLNKERPMTTVTLSLTGNMAPPKGGVMAPFQSA